MTRDVAPSSVELACSDDVVDLVELESMLFVEDAGVHDRYADVGWPGREGAADFRRLLADPSCVVFVARRDGAVVGSAAGYVSESGPTRQPMTFGVLRSMYVRGDARHAGIGGRLTDAFIDWARERGCGEVCVDSYFDNQAARRLYGRHGFAPRSVSHVLRL